MPMIYDQEIPEPLQRVAITGDPKSGKSPLATQLPLGTPYFGEALYIASDSGSEGLRSTPAEMRKHLHVVKPLDKDPKTGQSIAMAEMWDILMRDWTKPDPRIGHPGWPNVKTLIWDTASETGEDVLYEIADKGQFSDSAHITIGDPGSSWAHNIPMQGDYGAAQDEIAKMLKLVLRSPLHVFVLFHLRIHETKGGQALVGGPGTVGSATIRKTAKPFDAVLRTEKKLWTGEVAKQKVTEQRVHIHSEASGIWVGGVRKSGKNPMPLVSIPNDKPLAAYWPRFMESFYPEVSSERYGAQSPVPQPQS